MRKAVSFQLVNRKIALSFGERVSRCQRFHQLERDG